MWTIFWSLVVPLVCYWNQMFPKLCCILMVYNWLFPVVGDLSFFLIDLVVDTTNSLEIYHQCYWVRPRNGFLGSNIPCSSGFRQCICSGTSWKSTFSFSIDSRSTFETSMSDICICERNTRINRIPCSSLYFSIISYFVRFFMDRVKIAF